MADGDGVSTGEVYRRLLDHKQDSDRTHAALDAKLTELAKDTVPLLAYQQAERARDAELQRMNREHDQDLAELKDNVIKPLVSRVEKLEERPGMTLGRWMGILTVAAAFLALAVQAYGTLKGAK